MWRKIPDLLDVEINNKGELRNSRTEKPIKGYLNSSGYLQVNVPKYPEGRKSTTVHRLMGEVFFDMVTDRKIVLNHKDGNKTNNELSNLEIISAKENIEHAYRLGLNGKSNLNAEKVREIRKLRSGSPLEWPSIRTIAKQYGVSNTTIQHIISGKTWKHVE